MFISAPDLQDHLQQHPVPRNGSIGTENIKAGKEGCLPAQQIQVNGSTTIYVRQGLSIGGYLERP